MHELAVQIRDWLDEAGVAFFRKVKAEHGAINAVWMEGGVPHVVHFRQLPRP